MELNKIIYYSSVFSPILGILISYLIRKKLEGISKIILYLLVFSLILDISGFVSAKIFNNNLWVSNIYHPGFLAFSCFFFIKAGVNKIYLLPPVILSASIYIYITITTGFLTHHSLYYAFNNIIIIFFCVIIFYLIFKREESLFIEQNATFWFNTGLFIYVAGSLFTFLLGKEILSSSLSWVFHNISNILKNVLLAFGIYQGRISR